jgi:hypothetical protein
MFLTHSISTLERMLLLEAGLPDGLGKSFRASDWKMLILYFMAIWNILWIFGKCYDHFVFI